MHAGQLRRAVRATAGGIEGACEAEAEPAEKAKAGIRAAAVLLAGDPPTARLLTVEIAAAGTEGVRLQHGAIEQLAARLHRARESGDSSPQPPPSAEWAAVAAMVALVAKRAAEGESADAAELETLAARP